VIRSDYHDTIVPIAPDSNFSALVLKLLDVHIDPEIPSNHSKRVRLFLEHDLDNDIYPRHNRQTLKRAGIMLNEVIYARVNWEGLERAEPETWPSRWVSGNLAEPWKPMEDFGEAPEEPAVGADSFG
jgi:hypothetical protein